MVAHIQVAAHPEWSVLQNKPEAQPGRLFVLLVVRASCSLNKQLPPTQSHLFRGVDLEDAKQTAHRILRHDADVKHVAVLDEDGVGVLGIANRSAMGWQVPAYSVHQLAFH